MAEDPQGIYSLLTRAENLSATHNPSCLSTTLCLCLRVLPKATSLSATLAFRGGKAPLAAPLQEPKPRAHQGPGLA